MNPLTKVRDGAASALNTSRSGIVRTAGWVKGGVTSPVKKARWRVAELVGRSEDAESEPAKPESPSSASETGEGIVARLLDGARSSSRVAIAWAVAAFLVVAWIAWAIYVTAENGANAGLGVVISWPAMFAALALIAAPFVATWMLVQRHRVGGGAPAMAGAAQMAEEAEAPGQQAEGSDDGDDGKGFIAGPPVKSPVGD